MGKSTGPRTPQGKSRSSKNAAKHWIESQRILPDEQKEAASLRQGFADEFRPAGALEHELMDDLTLNRLIKRRIDAAYTREFSKARRKTDRDCTKTIERSARQYWISALQIRPPRLDTGLASDCARTLRLLSEALKRSNRGPRGTGRGDFKAAHFYREPHPPSRRRLRLIVLSRRRTVPTAERTTVKGSLTYACSGDSEPKAAAGTR
jgi:hypothetical protein